MFEKTSRTTVLKIIAPVYAMLAPAAPTWAASPPVSVAIVQSTDLHGYTPWTTGGSAVPVFAGDQNSNDTPDKGKDQSTENKDGDKDKDKHCDDGSSPPCKPPHPSPHL